MLSSPLLPYDAVQRNRRGGQMAAGVAVMERRDNVVFLGRVVTPEEADRPRRRAIARLRRALGRGAIVYAVRRPGDADAGSIVCDLFRIDGPDVDCITADVATALDCYDPAREIGVRLLRTAGVDPLSVAIDGRLSTLLFGAPDALRHRLLD